MKFNIPFFNKKKQRNNLPDRLSFGLNDLYSNAKAMKLSAVYRAIELKSNAVASIPLLIYNTNIKGDKITYSRIDNLHYVLNERPSARLDAFTFWKMLVVDLDVNGNSYALIVRNDIGQVTELIYVPPEFVSIPNADFIFENPRYIITGYPEEVNFMNILHIRNHTKNGIRGISTLSYASETLGIAYATEMTASKTFKNGGKLTGVYTVNAYLDEEKRKEINQNWNNTFSSPNSNGIVLLENGDTFNSLQMNNKDMMMIESRMFNVIDIARFFCVSPILLYDFTKMSYAGLEEVQLEFVTNTIIPILNKIEKELNYKLLNENQRYTTHIKFDTSNYIKTDKKTTAEYYSKLFNAGILTPNEIRNELGYKDIEGGNTNYIQVNLMKVGESAMDGVNKDIETSINQIDNKLK